MEQAMQKVMSKVVTCAIYGVLLMATLTILKLLLSRSSLGKTLRWKCKKEGIRIAITQKRMRVNHQEKNRGDVRFYWLT